MQELTAKQTAILDSAARLVKSGGRLVYATCSALPEENEAIAQALARPTPDFVALDAGEVLAQLKVDHARQPVHRWQQRYAVRAPVAAHPPG